MNGRRTRRAWRRRIPALATGAMLSVGTLVLTAPPAGAAVTAIFTLSGGVLTVIGDNLDNTVALSRNPAGRILVNGGAVSVLGEIPTVANVTTIQVFGLAATTC